MSYGQVSGKVVRRKNKAGYSYNFLLVKCKRNFMTQKSERLIIKNFGTIRDSDFNNTNLAFQFWLEVNQTLLDLANSGQIYVNCIQQVQRKFSKHIPIPIASSISTRKVISDEVADRLKSRFPELFDKEHNTPITN